MKPYSRKFSNNRNTQSGAALIISMILLTIITILSVTAMRNTRIETKIAVNHQFKEMSFRAAENALAIVTGPKLDSVKLKIPKVVKKKETTNNLYSSSVKTGPSTSLTMSTDVDLLYKDIIDPKKGEGNMLFSGHQLDIITHLYQADATGTVSGTSTQNRMQLALIRQQ